MGNRQEKGLALFLAVLMVMSIVVIGVAFAGTVAAEDSYVVGDSDDADYTSIQHAVENISASNSAITVEDGTYEENIIIASSAV